MAFFKGSQSATYKIKAEAEEEAREYERAGNQAAISGLQREQKEAGKPVDVKNRTDFEWVIHINTYIS